MHLGSHDVYASVAGGLRVQEPAADLGIALAIASVVSRSSDALERRRLRRTRTLGRAARRASARSAARPRRANSATARSSRRTRYPDVASAIAAALRANAPLPLFELVPNLSEGRSSRNDRRGDCRRGGVRRARAASHQRCRASSQRAHDRGRCARRVAMRPSHSRASPPSASICESIAACIRASARSTCFRSFRSAAPRSRMPHARLHAKRRSASGSATRSRRFIYGAAASDAHRRAARKRARRRVRGLARALRAHAARRRHHRAPRERGRNRRRRAADPGRLQHRTRRPATLRSPGASPRSCGNAQAACVRYVHWACASTTAWSRSRST